MTWWKGRLVGKDRFGNRYYQEKNGERRWVLYNGAPEASKVPPEWHGWLHRTVDEPPSKERQIHYDWQKEHIPNLTGTPAAYRPLGSLLDTRKRPHATGDYEPWQPE